MAYRLPLEAAETGRNRPVGLARMPVKAAGGLAGGRKSKMRSDASLPKMPASGPPIAARYMAENISQRK